MTRVLEIQGRVGADLWKVLSGATMLARILPCTSVSFCATREREIREREFFIDNLLVRIHFIIVVIRWTHLALHLRELLRRTRETHINYLRILVYLVIHDSG